jgi:lipopolysaccharide transport system ATP-binding protein
MPGEPGHIWALRDVSFQVKRGEVLGIIGRNGAGKTTLLKILSRITKPTKGRACINGRVGSLLEVGTGFHAELTGRENIFLNGAILGMTKAEIRRKFDEIVEFAEIKKIIDTPVKRYSSGMYVRLAFAVAAHLEPEILLVDEVLAVGDSEFQKKCLGKMKDVSELGRTVLFVSHNMGMIDSLCRSCILIEGGIQKTSGKPKKVIFDYFNISILPNKWVFRGGLAQDVRIKNLTINNKSGNGLVQVTPSEDIEIKVQGICKQNIPDMKISITISIHGTRVATLWDTENFSPLQNLRKCIKFNKNYNIPQRCIKSLKYTSHLSHAAFCKTSRKCKRSFLRVKAPVTRRPPHR